MTTRTADSHDSFQPFSFKKQTPQPQCPRNIPQIYEQGIEAPVLSLLLFTLPEKQSAGRVEVLDHILQIRSN
jgi:hypothetical protein